MIKIDKGIPVPERKDSTPFYRTLDTRRLSDPAYLADAWRQRHALHHQSLETLNRAVREMLVRFGDLCDRDHVVRIMAAGIDSTLLPDTTTLDWAEGAYLALVRHSLIAGDA